MSVLVPHFAFPFKLNGSALSVNEQDSELDVQTCVEVCLLTPPNSRMVLPTYGVPELLYTQAPVNMTAILTAVTAWEPRGVTMLNQTIDTLDQKILHVQVTTTGVV